MKKINRPLQQYTVATMPVQRTPLFVHANDVKVLSYGYFVRRSALVYEKSSHELHIPVLRRNSDDYMIMFDCLISHEVYSRWWQILWYSMLSLLGVYTLYFKHDGLETLHPIKQISRWHLKEIFALDFSSFSNEQQKSQARKLLYRRLLTLCRELPLNEVVFLFHERLYNFDMDEVDIEIDSQMSEIISKLLPAFIRKGNPETILDTYLLLITHAPEVFVSPFCEAVYGRILPWVDDCPTAAKIEWKDEIEFLLSDEYLDENAKLWLSQVLELFATRESSIKKRPRSHQELDTLKDDLAKAIATENFEKAATLRDKINRKTEMLEQRKTKRE